MNDFHKVRLRLNAYGRGTIELDGKPLNGVYQTEVSSSADGLTQVKFALYASEVDVEAEAQLSGEIYAHAETVTTHGL